MRHYLHITTSPSSSKTSLPSGDPRTDERVIELILTHSPGLYRLSVTSDRYARSFITLGRRCRAITEEIARLDAMQKKLRDSPSTSPPSAVSARARLAETRKLRDWLRWLVAQPITTPTTDDLNKRVWGAMSQHDRVEWQIDEAIGVVPLILGDPDNAAGYKSDVIALLERAKLIARGASTEQLHADDMTEIPS